MLGALGAGLVGWLLCLSGAGKLTLWAEFRGALAQGGVLPARWAQVSGWGAPWAEVVVGAAVLVRPAWWNLAPAAALFALFGVYQLATMRTGKGADCHCYGRLRQIKPGRPAAVGNTVLTAVALAAALALAGAGGWHVLVARLGAGLVLAGVYLAVMGTRSNPAPRFVFAEVRYLQERSQGRNDQEARAAVAREFGLSEEASYLLLPRGRARVILMRQRLGLKTTL